MEMILGEKNPTITYTRYETPSAFRRAGAFLPRKIIEMDTYEYRLSPYMGCSKRCTYCFELHNEFVGPNEVKIKTNTVSLLKEVIPTLSERKAILLDGYDCEYVEKKEQIIRTSLEVILEYELPVFIQTKSDLVLRDLDLLSKLREKTFVTVSFSLTSVTSNLAELFEPYTCAPLNRLRALRKIADCGITTGIILMPILPFISDTRDELQLLFSEAAKNNCTYIVPEPLRLTSSGAQREMWFNTLQNTFPSLKEKYEALYPETPSGWKFGSGPKNTEYLLELSKKIELLSKEYGISTDFPAYKPEKKPIVSSYQKTLDRFL
jgi:DNA repair photolyase